jgi:hypothetical protein
MKAFPIEWIIVLAIILCLTLFAIFEARGSEGDEDEGHEGPSDEVHVAAHSPRPHVLDGSYGTMVECPHRYLVVRGPACVRWHDGPVVEYGGDPSKPWVGNVGDSSGSVLAIGPATPTFSGAIFSTNVGASVSSSSSR